MPFKSINLILILDNSGSMLTQIPFNNGTISRLDALKNATNQLLIDLSTSDAVNARVHLVNFNSWGTSLGTFDLIIDEVQQNQNLAHAMAAIGGLVAGGGTNYEASLSMALDWVHSATSDKPLANLPHLINAVIFVSDGEPTYYVNANNGLGGHGNTLTVQTIGEPLGTDGSNEVGMLESQFGQIQAVGINANNTAVNILTGMEGVFPNDGATNIQTAEQLTDALHDLSPIYQIIAGGADVINNGNDTINAGRGADLVDASSVNNVIDLNDSDTLLMDMKTWAGIDTVSNFNAADDKLEFANVVSYNNDLNNLNDLLSYSTSGVNNQNLNIQVTSGANTSASVTLLNYGEAAANLIIQAHSVSEVSEHPVIVNDPSAG